MSEIISIFGSPFSGKSTFATKLALNIYGNRKCKVVALYSDYRTPMLPVIFPNSKADELHSLGAVLSQTEISAYEIEKQTVLKKSMDNMGFLGFRLGENKFTYPQFGYEKTASMLEILRTLADYIIIDCTSDIENVITLTALKCADKVIQLASPDLKSVSFFTSQQQLLQTDRNICGINITDGELFLPISEMKSYMPDIRFILPFSLAVRQQMLDGKLLERADDRKFNEAMSAVTVEILKEVT